MLLSELRFHSSSFFPPIADIDEMFPESEKNIYISDASYGYTVSNSY